MELAMPSVIRMATDADLPAISAIYNHYVLHSTSTYQETPETLAMREEWFSRHDRRYPATVAEAGGQVVGWGSLSPFHARSAYRFTVENSVYVHPDHQRKGIGSALLGDLIIRAADLRYHSILAGIDAGQPASVALHRKHGFAEVAHLREVGFKFDRWLDVIYMQLLLSEDS